MGTFDASLRTMGDRKGLAATLRVADGRLAIDAGDQPIGEWSLEEIRLEPIPTGYRLAAEGEQILLDIDNVDDFTLAVNGKKVKHKKSKDDTPKPAKEARAKKAAPAAAAETTMVAAAPADPVKEPKKTRQRKHVAPESDPAGIPAKAMLFLDQTLDHASEKWGNLLPTWVFTRGTVYMLAALLAVVVIFPGVIFWAFLITGVLMVMFGAVVYTDQVVAARWLPGRMTSMHILIYGVGLVVSAVFVGVAANNRFLILGLGIAVAAGVMFAARFRTKPSA